MFIATNLPYAGRYIGDGNTTSTKCIESSGKYVLRSYYNLGNAVDKTINVGIKLTSGGGNTYPNVFIVDSDYTDAASFKTAMSGIYIYYELFFLKNISVLLVI